MVRPIGEMHGTMAQGERFPERPGEDHLGRVELTISVLTMTLIVTICFIRE
jgi:hypothetical protein